DLVELMARERGLAVDAAGWSAAREKHQAASRSEGAFKTLLTPEQLERLPATRSTYHDDDTGAAIETRVAALHAGEERDALVLEASPFYAESGGQIGDEGTVEALDGTFRFQVQDTQKVGG